MDRSLLEVQVLVLRSTLYAPLGSTESTKAVNGTIFHVGLATISTCASGRRCSYCEGALVDVLLDWEDELRDYEQAVDLSQR